MYKLNITNEDINIVVDNIKEYIKYIEKLTNIIWKIIPDYNDYIISEYGNIISIRSKKILNPSLDKDKYYRINLYKNNIRKNFLVHRLVFYTFINNKNIEEFDIHHRDENRINNHYSNLEKINHSNHKKYHWNQESEKYLNQYKMYYDLKYKENLSTKEIAKRYNVSESAIDVGIRNYKIHLFNNKDINKYNNLNTKEKQDFYNNVILKENRKEYLKQCKKYYDLKYKENLSTKEIAKKYNVSKTTVNVGIRNYKIYLSNNEDMNKYNNFNIKEKKDFYNNVILKEDKRKNLKEYLEKAEQIYNKKNKENLTYEELSKIYNIPKTSIIDKCQDIEVFIFILDRDFDKFYNLSKKEKEKLYKKNTKNKRSEYLKNYLRKCEQIYNSKYKDHLSIKELIKLYNMTETDINHRIKDYEIFTFILDKNFDKFYNLSRKEKLKLRKKETIIKKEKNLKEYLIRCEKIYSDKIKYNLINKDLSKKYNIPEYIIKYNIKDHEVYLYLNRDFDKFYNLSKKEKEKLYKKNTKNKRIKETKEYLKLYEEIYNKKYEENLSNIQLSKIYGVSSSCIDHHINDIKFYIFLLDRNFDKFYNLSGKEKEKLRKKIVTIDKQNNNILDIGKQIEDLKLSGTSNRDIANKLNLSVNRISDIYKKYKKLINDNKIKDELKSIKNNNK